MTDIIEFCSLNGIHFIENALLKDYLTFKVGGPCALMFFPDEYNKIINLIKFLKLHNFKYYVIGRGSNLLCSDEGFDGFIINTSKFDSFEVQGDKIISSSGASLMKVCRAALDFSLSGLECEYGIPGSVGGAVYMNAGAYGGEIKDVVSSVTHISCDGKIETLFNDKLNFGYRHSFYSDNNCFILSAEFSLKPGDYNDIKNKMDDLISRRKDKQPIELPSAGSTFKRPEGYYAGALIEECGLKGFTVGGACVSEKHAGFIVNKGEASCADICNLIDYCRETVFKKTGVNLEPEVRFIS